MTKFIIVAAICGGGAVLSSYLYVMDEKRIGEGFESTINKLATNLESELGKTKATLKQMKSVYESIGKVEPEQFRQMAKEVVDSSPAMSSVAWAPLVLPHQRHAFEERMRLQIPDFQIKEIPSKYSHNQWIDLSDENRRHTINFEDTQLIEALLRPFAFPVIVIEPNNSAFLQSLIGLDITGVPQIAVGQGMMNMIQEGRISVMPPIPSPFSKKQEPIIVTIVPIMSSLSDFFDAPDIVKGFILSTFVIEDLVNEVVISNLPENVNLLLSDESGDGGLKALYRLGNIKADQRNTLTIPISVNLGRRWILTVQPSEAYIEARRSPVPLILFLASCVSSFVLIFYINALQHRATVVENLVKERTVQLQGANEKLEKIANQDGLTNIANRRYFDDMLAKEWNRALNGGTELAVVLVDVDFFKGYNDFYGHLEGDECLQRIALELKQRFRRVGDVVARYGGEEFAIILPNAGEESTGLADKARHAIENLKIEHESSPVSDYVTISVGISRLNPTANLYPECLLDSADRGLYKAKDQGRNCTVYHDCQINRLQLVKPS